jgi:hypothetical protein
MDASEFIRNTSAHDPEELERLAEHHVAWSEDGKQILASAKDLAELYREVDRKGLVNYVIGFVPSGDVSDLGGATF